MVSQLDAGVVIGKLLAYAFEFRADVPTLVGALAGYLCSAVPPPGRQARSAPCREPGNRIEVCSNVANAARLRPALGSYSAGS